MVGDKEMFGTKLVGMEPVSVSHLWRSVFPFLQVVEV